MLSLWVSVACGGSSSRHDHDASPPSTTGGTKSDPTPAGGGIAGAGTGPTRASGGKETSSGAGSGGSAGAGVSGDIAEVAGAPSGDGGSAGNEGTGAAGSGGSAASVHDRCADPWQLEFVDGVATVSDDTSRATDEFPTLVCGRSDPQQGFRGGQIYYRFTARPGREYALRLKASDFSGVDFYVFPAAAACTAESIRAACSSEGVSGTIRRSIPSTALTSFAPREPGDYLIGVDTTLTKGERFTLTVFEYCGTSEATDCKVKGCDLKVWRTCLGNTISACSDDATATVTTDCAMTNKSCEAGTCVASVIDHVGYTGGTTTLKMTAGAAGVTLLDFYEVTTSRTLTKLEIIMVQPEVFTLDWRILESPERAGPYQTIFTTTTMSAGASETSSETTGPIRVPLVAGRFYAMGVALPAGAQYFVQQEQADKILPQDVFFGRLTSAAVVPSASPSVTIGYPTPDNFSIAQWVTTEL